MLSRRRLLLGLLGLGLSRAQGLKAEEVVGGLEVPWALAFLPGGGCSSRRGPEDPAL